MGWFSNIFGNGENKNKPEPIISAKTNNQKPEGINFEGKGTSKQVIKDVYKTQRDCLFEWRNRYTPEEYPYKIVFNMIYQLLQLGFMWNEILKCFRPDIQKVTDFSDAYSFVMKLKEVAVSNIRSKVEETYKSRDMIGNFNLQKFRSMVTEAQKGNNEILQKIEKSYLLYTGGVELMYHWAAYGLMGLTYSEAFEQFLDIIYLTINPQDFSQMQTMFGNNINLEYQCLPDYLEKKQNFEFYFKRGYEKTIRNMHREAIEDYNLAIAINPNNPDVYHYRGTSKDELKDYKGSILDYNKAIYILTKTIEYYSFNKNNQTKMNDYKENNYNQNNYMDDKSKLANILYDRGSAKDEIQDFIGAINDYSKTIEINPNNFKAYVNRGLAKYHMKDNLSAIGIRRQLIVNFKLKLLIFIELHQIISYK